MIHLAGITSAVATAASMPGVLRFLQQRQLVDVPNARSSHKSPTPRGGGLACAVGTLTGVAVAACGGVRPSAGAMVGMSSMTAVGFIDDRLSLSAKSRLAAQILSGSTVGVICGGKSTPFVGAVLMPVVVNSFNFMDGINGISAGQVIAWATQAARNLDSVGLTPQAALATSASGAGLAFLPWNVPAARVFLGDVGSYLFGACIATIALDCWSVDKLTAIKLAVPYSIYLADTGWTILGRLSNGETLTEAHRGHIYQQLADLPGVAQWQVAVAVSALTVSTTAAYRMSGIIGLSSLLAAYLMSPRLVASVKPPRLRG